MRTNGTREGNFVPAKSILLTVRGGKAEESVDIRSSRESAVPRPVTKPVINFSRGFWYVRSKEKSQLKPGSLWLRMALLF